MNITISSNLPSATVDVVMPSTQSVDVTQLMGSIVDVVALPGPPGPQGPPGTDIIAVPYANWPPVAPQPNTLYLRMEP
jgi:hypothetical protein